MKTFTSILLAAAALAALPAAAPAAVREFDGTVVSVNRDNRTFRLPCCSESCGARSSDYSVVTRGLSDVSGRSGASFRERHASRRRDSADARAVMLYVTPAGRRLTQRILPIAERYETVSLAGFSAGEAETLKAALRRLYANMDALKS